MQRERTHTTEITALIYRDMGIYIKEITANLLGILKKKNTSLAFSKYTTFEDKQK